MEYKIKDNEWYGTTLEISRLYPPSAKRYKFAEYHQNNRYLSLYTASQGTNMVVARIYDDKFIYVDRITGASISCPDHNIDINRLFDELNALMIEVQNGKYEMSEWLRDTLNGINKLLLYKNEILVNYEFVKDEYSHLEGSYTWPNMDGDMIIQRCSDELKPFIICYYTNKSVTKQAKKILAALPITTKSAAKR